MITVWIILGVVVLIGIFLWVTYNSLVTLRIRVDEAWSDRQAARVLQSHGLHVPLTKRSPTNGTAGSRTPVTNFTLGQSIGPGTPEFSTAYASGGAIQL